MARAQGARAQMALAFETTYGTPPVSGYTKMPFASTTLGAEQPLQTSELLGYRPAERHKAGYLSWALVEQNVARVLYRMATFNRILTLGLGTGAFISAPLYILQTDGMPQRFGSEIAAFIESGYTAPSHTRCSDNVTRHCVLSGSSLTTAEARASVGAILIGDSHAGMVAEALAQTLPTEHSRLALFNQGACPTINNINIVPTGTEVCRAVLAGALALREARPDLPVFIANRWSFYVYGFNETRRSISPNYYVSSRFEDWSGAYRDEILSGYAEGAAADRRQAAHPICGRRGHRGRDRHADLCDGAQQAGDRGSF